LYNTAGTRQILDIEPNQTNRLCSATNILIGCNKWRYLDADLVGRDGGLVGQGALESFTDRLARVLITNVVTLTISGISQSFDVLIGVSSTSISFQLSQPELMG